MENQNMFLMNELKAKYFTVALSEVTDSLIKQ